MNNPTISIENYQPFWEEDDEEISPEVRKQHTAMGADAESAEWRIQQQEQQHRCDVAIKVRRERWALVRIVRILATPLRVFRASSAEAASRHRQEDDAGGEDDDPDLPPWRWYLPPLTGHKSGILERTYRLSLLAGGEIR